MDPEELTEYHTPLQFSNGQRVMVAKVSEHAHAWYGRQTDKSKSLLGRIVFVRSEDPVLGYYCSERLSFEAAYFPSCDLSAYNEDIIIEVMSITEEAI